MTVLGITGTRDQLTECQSLWLSQRISETDVLHHGACVGADAAAHLAAKTQGRDVQVHPPSNEKLMMPRDEYGTWLPAKPYIDRNHDIVNSSDHLIAIPNGSERARSGTWATVRYAVRQGKPVTICYPDGSLEYR